jgi:hypothetical protein
MELGEVKGTTIYTRNAAHRPSSHMILMGKILRGSERSNKADNQIPGDLVSQRRAHTNTREQLRKSTKWC